jgi:hypothetical protein
MGSARPLPFAGTELAHDPMTHRFLRWIRPAIEPPPQLLRGRRQRRWVTQTVPLDQPVSNPAQGPGEGCNSRGSRETRGGRGLADSVTGRSTSPSASRISGIGLTVDTSDLPPEKKRLARTPCQGRAHDARTAQAGRESVGRSSARKGGELLSRWRAARLDGASSGATRVVGDRQSRDVLARSSFMQKPGGPQQMLR